MASPATAGADQISAPGGNCRNASDANAANPFAANHFSRALPSPPPRRRGAFAAASAMFPSNHPIAGNALPVSSPAGSDAGGAPTKALHGSRPHFMRPPLSAGALDAQRGRRAAGASPQRRDRQNLRRESFLGRRDGVRARLQRALAHVADERLEGIVRAISFAPESHPSENHPPQASEQVVSPRERRQHLRRDLPVNTSVGPRGRPARRELNDARQRFDEPALPREPLVVLGQALQRRRREPPRAQLHPRRRRRV